MRDLERELRGLEVAWPETPDLVAAIRPRLQPHARRAWGRGRVAAVVVALLLGGVAAVEPARSAVLEFLGLKSVRIERREPTAPVRPPGTGLQLGRSVTQAQADREAGFRSRPPAALGRPDGIFVADGRVSYTYRPRAGIPESAQTGVGALVTVFPPTVRPFVEKTVGLGADLRRFEAGGDPGYYISGAPHGVAYEQPGGRAFFEEQRLAGATLLLERDDLLIRIEGELSQARATRIATSIPRATR